MVGRIAVEQALRSVVVPDELLKVLVLNDHSGQTAVGLLNEREIRPQIVGLIAEAGEGGGVALADDLVKRLRRKFREAGCRAAIETVWGYGFRLEEDRGERS